VLCVFQPHQVSRTARLLDELAASLHNGLRWQAENRLWIADIYRAREGTPAPGEVTSADLAARVRRPGLDVARTHEIEQIGHHLANELKPGDVLLTMGAGNIRQVLNQVNDSIRILE
jgi:UDP-N-acetylmuramate--alanine ligase